MTVTEAVRDALTRALDDLERETRARDRRLRDRLARLDTLPRRPFSEKEMYDALGLPR